MVFTPHWIQNLSFSTDYWNVHIRNAILDGGPDPNFTIKCLLQREHPERL
ncbi:MAG: hypothetical protein WDN69_08870 [Aliidongia sp.]